MILAENAILNAKLLIVDDQTANVRLLERLLGDAGYVHVSSTTAPQDVPALHHKNRYDLILLDLQMPVMDGFEVMERLKEIEPGSYLPVIVLTAQPVHKLRALQSGAKDFISKPFDLVEVKTRIRNMLEVRLLYRMLEGYNETLERTVTERTAELTALTYHLQTAREDERARLARDLHDEMGALMTSAKLDAARIRARLTAMVLPAPEALERLAHLIDTLNKGIALKRRIVEDLHPSSLNMLGLVVTLEIMAREFADSSGLEVVCALEPVSLSASSNLMVYRLMQEALTNISKYAQASRVWMSLSSQGGQVEASVRDNGVGFDTRAPTRSAHGLVGMRFRVEAEGGVLSIVASPGLGTLLLARLPALAAPAPVVVAGVAPPLEPLPQM